MTHALRRGAKFLERLAEEPVVERVDGAAIREHLNGTYTFTAPVPSEELVEDVARMLETWGVQTIHPRYYGYFNPSPLPEAIAGDLIAAIYNPQLAVWSHGPAAVEVEQHTLRWLGSKFGLPPGFGAHFTTGGSEANLTAVVAALTARFPGHGEKGLSGTTAQPLVYQSAATHDSFAKICRMTGLGLLAVRAVPVDDDMRLAVETLRQQIKTDRADGYTPVMVIGNAGTTTAGIIDPLDVIADVAREHDLWFHVDAAWGGAAVLSPLLRRHLRGIEAADSITCDAHKWLNVTMGAGMFFCRDAEVLGRAFATTTGYMPGVGEGSVDPYATSVQWSRRFIGLKLFMALAARGESGYAEMIEGQAAIGDYLREQLSESGWRHVAHSPLPVCCVTHPRITAGESNIESVLRAVLDSGRAWISKVRLRDRLALRACITSYRTRRDDVDVLVEEMDRAVADASV